MKTLFSHKRSTLLTGGAIHLLILPILVAGLLISSASLALATEKPPKQMEKAFKVFCFLYYRELKKPESAANVAPCQKQSAAFSSLLTKASPKGFKQWPAEASLQDLADQDLLVNPKSQKTVNIPEDFVKIITNKDLRALVSGRGDPEKNIPKDPDFLLALWEYKSPPETPEPPATSEGTPTGSGTPTGNDTPTTVTCNLDIQNPSLSCLIQ